MSKPAQAAAAKKGVKNPPAVVSSIKTQKNHYIIWLYSF